ncbi:MAG: VWA domain-containing protein [Terriglobia bacterium]|jgi:VWFA-related protein
MKTGTKFFLGFVTAILMFGNPANKHAYQDNGVIRTETRLVEISVVAQDSSGRAVTDLSRNDFTLYDNGKPVPIDEFSAVLLQRAPAETLPPNTFSNRVGGQPIITVVLLDGLNTSFHDQSWARTEVVRFLEKLRPEDRVGIMMLGEHLYVLQNFTSNPQILLAALRNAPVRNPREVAGSAPPPPNPDEADAASVNVMGSAVPSSVDPGSMPNAALAPSASSAAAGAAAGFAGEAAAMAQEEAIMNQFLGHESAYFQVDSAQRTLDALIAIAKYLAHFPGRKNLIWVSSAFPISIGFDTPRQPGDTRDQIHFTSDLEHSYKVLNSALNNASMAIYPVDARGLVAGAPGTTNWNNLYSSQGTMNELASATGGRAFVNTNDIARAMRAAADDSQASYELGFYPHDIKWNNQFHALKVKVSRPGVHLRYRQGYFATKEAPRTAKTGDQDKVETQFNQALYSPLDAPGLGLRVTLEKVTHHSDTRRVMGTNKVVPFHKDRALLAIDVDAHDIKLQGGSVLLAVVLAQTGPDGKVLDATRYDMKMRVAANGVQRLLGQGLRMDKWVDLVQGATLLELVVRDPGSGELGSVRIPVGGV